MIPYWLVIVLFSYYYIKELRKSRGTSLEDVEFKAINENLIDLIWTNKPHDSLSEIIIHELEYHQYPTTKKISSIFENLISK